jgi:hypothetical protein
LPSILVLLMARTKTGCNCRQTEQNFLLILTTNPLYWTRMLCGQLVSECSLCQVATFQVDFWCQNNLRSSRSIVAIGGTRWIIFLYVCLFVTLKNEKERWQSTKDLRCCREYLQLISLNCQNIFFLRTLNALSDQNGNDGIHYKTRWMCWVTRTVMMGLITRLVSEPTTYRNAHARLSTIAKLLLPQI